MLKIDAPREFGATVDTSLSFGEARNIWERSGFRPECSMTADDFDDYRNRITFGKVQDWKLPFEA